MLKGINPLVTPDLIHCLLSMGHGDELVIVDANFPAASIAETTNMQEPIRLPGFSSPQAAQIITELMPLDHFTETCALRMEIDGAPQEMGAVHHETFDIIRAAMPDGANVGSLERQMFYQQAARAFAVVATSEKRPFGCFILRKGVIF
ncbi:MAG: RbsD/FucU domain-containing protein [Rhizobiaceae bacterium]|nr:RbsD/FucU domain-containing protein [Rhizobiaceae bacterium]